MSCFCCQTDKSRNQHNHNHHLNNHHPEHRHHHHQHNKRGHCAYSKPPSPPPPPIPTAEAAEETPSASLNYRARSKSTASSLSSSTTTTATTFHHHPHHLHPHPHHQRSQQPRDMFMRRSSGRDGMEIGPHLRLSNSSSNNSSSSSLGSGPGPSGGGGGGGGGHNGREVNIAVLGSKGVGKSALIVRYLTRRFIGDYDSEMEAIFTHSATIDNKQITMHIMDTACHVGSQEPREDSLWWADGFLLVFSVTDAGSWAYAQGLVSRLRALREDDRIPVVLAANKSDLVHLQRVPCSESSAWAAQHGCELREVSVREDPESVEGALVCLCRQVRALQHKKREKLSWIMQKPAVAAKLQIRQSLRNFAEKTWRSRTSTL